MAKNMTPLKLAFQKCRECLDKGDTAMEPFYGIAVTLMEIDETAVGADESVLRLAINFPVFLKKILQHHEEYYECKDNSSPLTRAIRKGLLNRYSRIGFIELMLQKGADSIVMDLIDRDPAFLKSYINPALETPLHTAAKLGKDVIAKRLMGIGSVLSNFVLHVCCILYVVCVCAVILCMLCVYVLALCVRMCMRDSCTKHNYKYCSNNTKI